MEEYQEKFKVVKQRTVVRADWKLRNVKELNRVRGIMVSWLYVSREVRSWNILPMGEGLNQENGKELSRNIYLGRCFGGRG